MVLLGISDGMEYFFEEFAIVLGKVGRKMYKNFPQKGLNFETVLHLPSTLKKSIVMANQVVKAYFDNTIPAAITWTLTDASGVQSNGVTSIETSQLVMNVTYGMPLDHNYKLTLKNADGTRLESVKFNHADGGIVIVDNVDITREPRAAMKVEAVKTKR